VNVNRGSRARPFKFWVENSLDETTARCGQGRKILVKWVLFAVLITICRHSSQFI